ncbi:MAG: hypothetical protein RTV72_15170 [Candidatus Thorarchaeota archaeon]
MNKRNYSSPRGPMVIALGGTFVVYPILLYTQMLYDGRFSFPYGSQGEATLMMGFVCLFVFVGLLIASMGLQMILEDNNN